jgi:serine/threonine-protein kinase RsbW
MKSIIMKRAEIVLPDSYSGYDVLNEFVASFAESEGYSQVFTEDLQLAMKEAFVNAVRHGNREQPGLTVSCTLTAVADTLLVSVMDCGKGFNPDALPDPLDPMNLFKLSGRGIYIIRSIADTVTLKCDRYGSVLTMCYRPR